jgi:hypothetical protein
MLIIEPQVKREEHISNMEWTESVVIDLTIDDDEGEEGIGIPLMEDEDEDEVIVVPLTEDQESRLRDDDFFDEFFPEQTNHNNGNLTAIMLMVESELESEEDSSSEESSSTEESDSDDNETGND